MLSLFDRVDGARYRHWKAFVVVCACAMVGLRMRSGGQRSISDPEKSRLCLHRARLHTCQRSKSLNSSPCCFRPRFAIYWSHQVELDGLGPVANRLKLKESLQASTLTEPGALPPETGVMARNGHSGTKLLSALAAEPRSYRHLTSAAISGRIDSHALSNASKKSLDGNPVISTTRWVGRHLPSANSTCKPFGMRRVILVSRT